MADAGEEDAGVILGCIPEGDLAIGAVAVAPVETVGHGVDVCAGASGADFEGGAGHGHAAVEGVGGGAFGDGAAGEAGGAEAGCGDGLGSACGGDGGGCG